MSQLEVKRSVFMTYLQRVSTEDEARDVVADARRRHHDARHHCSAFLVGPQRELQRSSDDGEPAGTAGMPMLDALRQWHPADGSADLSDVCAVVVRWFGGIKLGAGGLVRAYSEAVTSALDGTAVAARVSWQRWRVDVPLADVGRVDNTVRQHMQVDHTDYGAATAAVTMTGPDSALPGVATDLSALLSRPVEPRVVGQQWLDVPLSH